MLYQWSTVASVPRYSIRKFVAHVSQVEPETYNLLMTRTVPIQFHSSILGGEKSWLQYDDWITVNCHEDTLLSQVCHVCMRRGKGKGRQQGEDGSGRGRPVCKNNP